MAWYLRVCFVCAHIRSLGKTAGVRISPPEQLLSHAIRLQIAPVSTDSADSTAAVLAGMIGRNLDLYRPRYKKTAAYGHFGREPTDVFTWEKVIDLKDA